MYNTRKRERECVCVAILVSEQITCPPPHLSLSLSPSRLSIIVSNQLALFFLSFSLSLFDSLLPSYTLTILTAIIYFFFLFFFRFFPFFFTLCSSLSMIMVTNCTIGHSTRETQCTGAADRLFWEWGSGALASNQQSQRISVFGPL